MPLGPKLNRVDAHLGRRLQTQRALSGLNQTELAEQLGITFQQLQKYETGSIRMSAGQLWQASRILGVSVSEFFAGLERDVEPAPGALQMDVGLEFVRDYDACPKRIRRQVYRLGKDLADGLGDLIGDNTE